MCVYVCVCVCVRVCVCVCGLKFRVGGNILCGILNYLFFVGGCNVFERTFRLRLQSRENEGTIFSEMMIAT